MEDLSSTPDKPKADDLDVIHQRLVESFRATAHALWQFQTYRDAVRGVVLDSLNQQPLPIERAEVDSKPRYDVDMVDMRVRLTVTIPADDNEQAAQRAIDLIQIKAGEAPLSIYDLDVVSVDPSDD